MLENKIIKKYNLGVIASRETNLDKITSVLKDKKDSIGHIYTNDVDLGGRATMAFALFEKIPFTCYPVKHIAGGILPSNQHIIHHSDFIYILDDGESGNVVLAQRECEKQSKKYKIIKL